MGCSIAGFLSAAAGWSHRDRIPLSEFTEQLLRQGTGAICYQLRSQLSLSPFNAERLFGGTEAEKPARFVPLPRHPVFRQSCQKCQQALLASPGAGPRARESPGCAGHSALPVPITSGEAQAEEMGAPQLPSSEVVDTATGSTWKAAECAGGRRQVPGSAHPTLQPAGSTTCSPDPAWLLLALLLCS